jgi:transketolase
MKKLVLKKADSPTRKSFSERMLDYAKVDKTFTVFESDIGYSTYSYLFGDKYPDRYFNMGIAELGTMAAAAGMAADGRTVIVSGYGVFLTMRASKRSGPSSAIPAEREDPLLPRGPHRGHRRSHPSSHEDIAFMSTLPEMKVLVPCDTASAKAAFDIAAKTPGRSSPAHAGQPLGHLPEREEFVLGGSKVLAAGKDVTIVSYGDIVFQALEAADALKKKGIEAEVVDMYSVKPFDAKTLLKSAKKTGAVLVAENHQRRNGLGYEIAAFLLKKNPVIFDNLGLDDTFGESGSYAEVIAKYGLSAGAIASAAAKLVKKKTV